MKIHKIRGKKEWFNDTCLEIINKPNIRDLDIDSIVF